MTDPTPKRKPRAVAIPLLIGPANAEAVTGFPWRWCRDTAAALGLGFVGHGRKRALRADAFIAALERQPITQDVTASAPPAPPTIAPADPAAHVRSLLGKRLKAGGE